MIKGCGSFAEHMLGVYTVSLFIQSIASPDWTGEKNPLWNPTAIDSTDLDGINDLIQYGMFIWALFFNHPH